MGDKSIPILIGTPLVSFGNKTEENGIIIKDNYGIGINSGDTNLTLPSRAISLFETQLESTDPEEDKISFNYRGILGTLPSDLDMASGIKTNMVGTQGIYTDNMYIGNASQYLAFYTKNGQKRLDVTGGIHALSLTIGDGDNEYNGIDAINISGYSLTITIEENSTLEEGKVYLYPHLYHNGIEQLPETGKEEEFYNNFKWYENDVLLINRIDPYNGGRIIANRENKYRLTYSFADGATEGAQPIQPIYVEPTEYITDIDQTGIKIHPKQWVSDSHYIQLDGEGMYVKESNGIDLAKFKDTITLGIDDGSQSYVYLDYHSLQMIEKEGDTYLHISDLRKEDGCLHIAFTGDGVTDTFSLEGKTIVEFQSITATVDDELVQLERISYLEYKISPVPSDGSIIIFRLKPKTKDKTLVKAYTLGKREANTIIGPMSYAEGINIVSSGLASHAEGYSTWASGDYSHAEGEESVASGNDSHAEGYNCAASGASSHAEGIECVAGETGSHAEGGYTSAGGLYSHSSGWNTYAPNNHQFVCGSFNDYEEDEEESKYIFVVGNGSKEEKRSNAFTITYTGDVNCQGNIDANVDEYDYTNYTYSSGFTYYATSGEFSPKACKFGRLVNLSGVIKATTARTGTAIVQIGRVPSGCEPLYDQHFHNDCGSGTAHCRITIRPNGSIWLDKYTAAVAVNHWFDITATYISKA